MANSTMDSSCIKGTDNLVKPNTWYAKQAEEREKIYQHTVEQFIHDLHPDVQLSEQQRTQLRELAKLKIGEDGALESMAASPHITSNWGQYQANPDLFLGIVQVCKLVGLAEMLEDGAEINTRYGQNYLEAHPKLEKAFATAGKLHLALSVLLNANAIHTLVNAEGAIHSFNGVANVITRLSDLGGDVTDVLDGWRNLPSMKKYTLGFKHWGSLAIGFSLIEGSAKNATALRSLFDEDSPLALRIMGSFQAGVGAAGGIANAVAMKIIMDRVEAGVKPITRSLRNTLIIAALCELATMPLDIYSIAMQHDYANKNNELDQKFQEHGYHGYGLLRDLYKDKATLDTVLVSLRTAVTVVHLSTSMALKASGIGMPVALAVDAVAMVASVVIDAIEQPILDKIAKAQLDKIVAWEKANPGKNYFVNALDAHYAERLDYIAQIATHTQQRWDVDQVIAITQMQTNDQVRELAMLVGRKDSLENRKLYADIFKEGQIQGEKNIELDPATGIININDNTSTQALVFTSPVFVPGQEVKTTHNDGQKQYTFGERLWQNISWALAGPSANGPDQRLKDSYQQAGFYNQKEELTVLPVNWQVNDKGTSSTKFSFSNIIQRIKQRDGTLKKIDINLHMGVGDDLVIAPADGALHVDGGEGNDAISYASFVGPIQLEAGADGTYTVNRQLFNAKVYEEVIQTQQAHFGRKSTKVEYRAFEQRIVNDNITDTLKSIEKIIGTQHNDQLLVDGATIAVQLDGRAGDDTIITGSGDDIVRGGVGKDIIKTRAGDDFIIQDDAHSDDYICGGDGNDTIDYSGAALYSGLDVNLSNETVLKTTKQEPVKTSKVSQQQSKADDWLGLNELQKTFDAFDEIFNATPSYITQRDTVKNVENIRTSNFADKVKMDDHHNIVYALDGDDCIETFGGDDTIIAGNGDDLVHAGDGNDTINGGQGNDRIFGEAGDDVFQQNDCKGRDTFDGGAGLDKVDYSNLLPSRRVIVDLLKGYAEKQIKKAGEKAVTIGKDRLINIEGVIGTQQKDRLSGDANDNLLDGQGGNDIFRGRGGNDLLRGGKDNDTYLFSKGDGHDIIEDKGGASDKIVFNSALNNFMIHRRINQLIISSNNNKDSVTVNNQFSNSNNKMEYICWDNKKYTMDDLTNTAATLAGAGATNWSYNASDLLQRTNSLS